MKILFKIFVISLIVLISSFDINPQCEEVKEFIVVANENYRAGWLHSFFAGKLWRDLWTTPFKVSVLDINKFAGGLTPIKTGGGLQTKSLHFVGGDGKKYKFRSIDKDPSRSLPVDLRESIVSEAMQDQVPVQNPVSSIIVAPLMTEVGILNAEPFLFLMPDDEKLKEYRSEFSNMLGTIEENPDDYEEGELNFAGASKIINTFNLLQKLEDDNEEKVDAVEFLKARLFDIFIGDRDRHSGQWKWAGMKSGKKRIWKPIPKDRDFAFPLYDGLIPRIMTLAITSLVHFDYDMPAMIDITWEGRHLDRRFLGSIEKSTWDSVANFMLSKITDEVIENSVRRMPVELFSIRGNEIIDKLRSRREQLLAASDEFYTLTMMYVDIYGSNEKEYAEVERIDDIKTSVKIFKRNFESIDEKSELLFEKVFNSNITKEIRIHLLDGDDKAIVKGKNNNSIIILIDGGDGADELIDSSMVKKSLLGFLPFKTSVKVNKFYDSGKKTKFITGSSTYINNRNWKTNLTPEEKYEPKVEDRYRDFRLLFPFAFNSDDGLIYGIGGAWNFYDYKVEPYSYRLGLTASYSTKSQSFEIIGTGDFNKLIEGANFNLLVKATGQEINRFYGFGNQTSFDEQLEDEEFYNVSHSKYYARGLFSFPLNRNMDFRLGLSLEETNITSEAGSLIDLSEFYGEGKSSFLSYTTEINYDSRDQVDSPIKGLLINLKAEQYPALLSYKESFGNLSLETRGYFTGYSFTEHTLAVKLFAEYCWGEYPFYKSANVGGKKNLRGFARNRFSGDAALASQIELRFLLGTVSIFIPGQLGLNIFTDAGRVFLDNEKSNIWHTSQGAGLWFSILNRMFTMNLNFAKSTEELRFYFSAGFSF